MSRAPLSGLLAARQAARRSQRDLGALIGKNQGHMGKIERGVVALEVRDALTLARALGVTVEYLVTGADESRDMIEALAMECERGARFIRSYDGKPEEIRAWAARCESMAAAGKKGACTPAVVLERAATEAREFLKVAA